MPRKLASISLSPGRAGINRYEGEALINQLSEADNVTNDDGDVRRRDAFVALTTAAPHYRPQGLYAYLGRDISDNEVLYPIVDPDGFEQENLVSTTENLRSVWIGHPLRKFDGFEIGELVGMSHPRSPTESEASTKFATTAPRKLRTYYWNGTAWTEMWHLDQSWLNLGGNRVSLLRSMGRVSWHTPRFEGEWQQTTAGPDDLLAYWIRVDIVDEEGEQSTLPTPTEDVVLAQPGFRIFDLEPVRSLAQVTMGSGKLMLIGSDRRPALEREPGAKLGAWFGRLPEPTRDVLIESRFSSGVYGEQEFDQWSANGTLVGPAEQDRGTAFFFTDDDDTINWTERNYYWPFVYQGLEASGGVDSNAYSPEFTAGTFPPATGDPNRFRGWLLWVTGLGSGSGLTPGQYHQVIDTQSPLQLFGPNISVWPPLAAAPVAGDTFALTAPGVRVEIVQQDRRYYPILTANNTVALGGSTPEWEPDPANALPDVDGLPVHVRALEEPVWRIPAGGRWSWIFDSGRKQVLLSNGESGLMRFDGRYLHRAEADTESAIATRYAGVPNEQVGTSEGQAISASNLEKLPPGGRFVIDYLSRTVVMGLQGDNQAIRWSAPYYRDIWPTGYVARLLDGNNLPIQGGTTLYDLLVAWTRESIHVSSPPDETGYFRFRPSGTAGGWLGNASVSRVPVKGRSVLIGPGADTLRLFDGAATEDILDEYDRVIPGGVNVKRLEDSVSVCWPQRTMVLWAVASAGSPRNDTLLVWNYETGAWWRWTYDLGISSLALWTGNDGRERLVAGTDDGFVVMLTDADTDDGAPVEAFMRSPPVRVLKEEAASFVALHLDLQEMGQGEVTVRSFVDSRDVPAQDAELVIDGGSATFDEAVFANESLPAETDAVFADEHQRAVRIPLRSGTVGNAFQYEVRGTKRWRLRSAELEVRGRSARGRK